MTCDEYQEMISEFIDAELLDEQMTELFSHLSTCRRCRASLGMMMHVRQTLAKVPQAVVRPGLDARVLEIPELRARTTRQKQFLPVRIWQNRVRLPLPALATLVFIALFSSALLLSFWLRTKEPVQQMNQKVVYLIGLEPVEVQGSYNETTRLPH